MLCYLAPQFKALFNEFDVSLSGAADLLIRISDAVTARWYRAIPLMLGLVAADASAFAALHARENTRALAKLWSGAITGLVVLAILASVFVLAESWVRLWGALG